MFPMNLQLRKRYNDQQDGDFVLNVIKLLKSTFIGCFKIGPKEKGKKVTRIIVT